MGSVGLGSQGPPAVLEPLRWGRFILWDIEAQMSKTSLELLGAKIGI